MFYIVPNSKVTGYKIKAHKSVVFIYTNDKLPGKEMKEIREATFFTIDTNSNRYLGVTLTKQVKDLYDRTSHP